MKRNAAIFFFGLICGFFVFSYLLSDRWLNSFRKSENIQRIELARVKILHDFDEINPAVKLYLGVLDTAYKETNCKDVSAPKHTEVEAPLIEKMPFPWPKQNVVVRKQPFNPIVFSDNTYSLMCHKDKFTTKWIQKFTDQILDELERWLVKDGKAVFFYYNFKYHPLDYDLPIKWRSAFAQGHILKGLTHLDSITNSKRVKRLLKGVFNSLNPSGRNYEVTFLDDHGYIWFDEYPLPGSRPTSYVLNGHIWALLGVYYYWVHTRDLRA